MFQNRTAAVFMTSNTRQEVERLLPAATTKQLEHGILRPDNLAMYSEDTPAS
jgi:hypothetical protein